jgi:peptidoglycan-N-acetylglucosamine deacetylase
VTTPGDSSLAASGARPPAGATAWPAYVKVSVACHLGAGAAALAVPSLWPWTLGAIAANHLVLTAGGLWPRSRWLGSNWTALPAASAERGEIAITIDDGPDPQVTPAVLDLLDAQRVQATFFCIAERARAHPALCREIVARGHSVQNHSDGHSHRFSLLGPRAMAREIGAAQASLAEITGILPRFFRAPAGLRNPFLSPILQRLDLQLVSWTRRGFDTVRTDPRAMLERLTQRLAAGDILLLHDGNAARTDDDQPIALAVLPALLAQVQARGLRPVTLPAAAADTPRAGDAAGDSAST